MIEQRQLPHFDQYFKHNDYIQNFELAAAMDITQHRVFDTLMSCVQTLKFHDRQYLFNNQNGHKLIKLNLDFFMQRYLKSHNIKSIKRSELKAAVKSLAQIVIIKDTEEGIRARPVFQEVFANTKENTIEIEISKYFSYDSLTPGKETKSPGYTKLLNSTQVNLKSIYARIIYQFFLSKLVFQNTVNIKFDIPKLHKMLGIVNEEGKFLKGKKAYAEVSQFKRRCLTESINSINNYTELNIIMKDVKEGRKVVAFIFEATKVNKQNESINSNDDNQLDEFRPKKNDFKDKDDFVTHMKIYYKNNKITNCVPGYNPNDFLVIDSKGMLCMENKENGIYRFSNNKNDKNVAYKIWEWLYQNIEKVGRFSQVSIKDIVNYKFNTVKLEIENKIFDYNKIEKDIDNWIIYAIYQNKMVTIKVPLTEDIERYLESIKV